LIPRGKHELEVVTYSVKFLSKSQKHLKLQMKRRNYHT